MVTFFGKDDKDNLTAAERNAVEAMLTKYEAPRAQVKKGGGK